MSEMGWRPARRIGGQIGAEIRRADRQIVLPGGGEFAIRSADNPDSLRGEALDFVVMDECAFIKEEAWAEALRPALTDRQGKALFISTPKGRNWFWRLWQRGQSDDKYKSWKFPTSSNPYIPKKEVDEAQRTLPERVFLQEFEAEFIDDAGGVFRRVMDAATSAALDERHGSEYVFGVDWGKYNDFTVISVIDIKTHQQVAMDRFNQIDYHIQTQRLAALAERFKPVTIIAEANSIGDPIIEQLRRMRLPVKGFTTTNATKTNIIEALQVAFERGDIKILSDPVQIAELQAYEMERLPSGLVRYNAPDGMHDDTVMALALAWYGAARPKLKVTRYAS